ncbi:MAG: hypothetical protein FVQ81_17115 [Candidatus Glassbacteria bacterium]|nr:hypothetical protein [Candidatus Glassbacteria bacterium]
MKLAIFTLVAGLIMLAVPPATSLYAAELNPHRVLLVIGDQWDDPASFLIDIDTNEAPEYDHTVRPKGIDFMQLVVMLKSWGIPFDIVRLDQQSLDINMFLGPDGKPSHGCVLWAADPRTELMRQDYGVLAEAVAQHGVSLVALSNRIDQPELEMLLGVTYKGYFHASEEATVEADHYLTRGLGPVLLSMADVGYMHRVQVETGGEVIVLAKQGEYPCLTLRETGSGSRAIWIGGDARIMFDQQKMRTLLRRAITVATGYCLYKTWENRKIIVMDDPGGAQNAWLEHWQYSTLTREQYRRKLIEPLKKHNAIMVINVIPGFVNEDTRRIESSFQRKFTDKFGRVQDYPSTKLGLEDGIAEGVFELQSHGWTHMQPDLESPPGPWWGAPLDGEKAEVGWYREFGDTRRGFVDIPAANQAFRMRTGRQWLNYQFGIDPLSFVSGGGGVSRNEYHNHTWILAAREGFGWFCWFGGYLGPEMAVRSWLFEGTAESPLTIPAMPDAHDKGIAEHPERFEETFVPGGPDAVYIGFNEFVGYLQAGRQMQSEPGVRVTFHYDDHYCQFFRDNESVWTLELADWARKELKGKTVYADGKAAGSIDESSSQIVIIPAGLGEHTFEIK